MNTQKTANVQNAAHLSVQIFARDAWHMAQLAAYVARCAAWHLANLAHGATPLYGVVPCAMCQGFVACRGCDVQKLDAL